MTDLPPLDVPFVIGNRDYQANNWLPLVTGEIPVTKRDRPYNGLWKPPAGLTGRHVCHPEWFATGEPWPPTLPPNQYSEDWIPLCCGRAGDPTAGGVEVGGEAGDVFTPADPTPGTDCASAPTLTLSQLYGYTSPSSGFAQQWFRYTVSNGTYRLTVTGFGAPSGPSAVYYLGASCGALGPPLSVVDGCQTITVAGEFFFRVSDLLGSASPYTFVFESGHC